MGLRKKVTWLIVRLFLTFLLLESCHALPPYRPGDGLQQEPQVVKRPSITPKTLHSHQRQDPIGAGKVYSQKSITVWCHDAWMEIVVKADLYNTGVLIDGDDLRLGETTPACRARQSAATEYTIVAALSDCGTRRLITDDSVIYTNVLIYSPVSSTNGIIRIEGTVLPIECHYRRRYGVSSSVLNPTWIPFASTQSAVDVLGFSLRLMNGDWLSEKIWNVYFLGDIISIEASVTLANHMPLRVFVDSCEATVFPDKNSVPRYSFIENGCLMDARRTGSNSHFLPRVQDDKLHIHLEAFRFYQEMRSALYITCHVKAMPVMHNADPKNRACSFINGSWRSVDGNDWICDNCETPNMWEKPVQSSHHGLEKELSLHPLNVFPSKQGGMAPRLQRMESRPMEAEVLEMGDNDEEPERETTPGPSGPPEKLGNGPLDPRNKEDNGHLGEPLAKEEAGAVIHEEEGSGMDMETVYVSTSIMTGSHSDQENDTTPSPVVHPGKDDDNPDVFSNEPVGPTVLPSLDEIATVAPSNEERDSIVPTSKDIFSPADFTSEEDASSVVPPDEPTSDRLTLPFSWKEGFGAFSDEGDSN
ncbi:uncharacterized protein LOC133133023 isoform X1 [Conger conger]|uniref:uncharacterized protein LOC133133023 isoform X1 n=1 Tax=Conger conger TaxID=82655 RepID=UPI002A5B10FA|nr:uncharacterized protein LOC133133023 isoform X1 [Conger conger]